MGKEDLKARYEKACNEYVKEFAKKQDIGFVGWVSDQVGYVADFGYTDIFSFRDIVWDINSSQPKGTIMQWMEDNLKFPEKAINYYSYTKGLRVKNIN